MNDAATRADMASETAGEAPETGDGGPFIADGIDDLRTRAAALAPGDIEEAKAIIDAAVVLAHTDDLERDRLLDALKKALGQSASKDALKTAWRAAKARLMPSSEAQAAAAAAVKAAERDAERARLAPLVTTLANRRDLIEHAADIVQALGIVGERKAIKANYIAMSSRVLAEPRVLSVVGTGVSSVGKSYLMNTVARLFPAECVEVITTGSPKALVFMVDENSRALAHKIVILHETAGFIAGSDTEDNPSATLVREMLTGGRIRHLISEKGEDGHFVTREIEVEGPISLVTTSARSNLDPEMENRLLEVPIDESPRTTSMIQRAQLSGDTRRKEEAAAGAVEKLVEFQRWLQLDAGVRVVIPDELLEAIAAVGGLPLTVQTRRDVPLFLLAVKACAVIHIARRKRDAGGRVIAEFEDYDAAHDAIDGFLAASYSTTLKPPEIAVLAAIEALIAEDQKLRAAEASVKKPEDTAWDGLSVNASKARFTYAALAARLGLKSRKTLARRVKALRLAKVISLVIERPGGGPPSSTWELLIPARVAASANCGRFMPPPEAVAELLADPACRKRRLDQIAAENGSLPDWRTFEADDQGDKNVQNETEDDEEDEGGKDDQDADTSLSAERALRFPTDNEAL